MYVMKSTMSNRVWVQAKNASVQLEKGIPKECGFRERDAQRAAASKVGQPGRRRLRIENKGRRKYNR